MRHPDRDAGSVPRPDRGRRRALGLAIAAAVAVVTGCSPTSGRRPDLHPAASSSLIVPLRSIAMARLILRVNQAGMPTFEAGGFGGFTPLVFPVAVAASTLDIFIADAGTGRLYRYDPTVDAMAIIGGATITGQTRLAASPDGSIVVSDPAAGAALRFDRAGNLLQRIDARLGAARYDDIAVDPESGRYVALDRLQQRLEEVHPVGRSGVVLVDRQLPDGPTGIALDRRVIYVGGRHCACVVAIDPATGRQTTVIDELKEVGPLAAGGGWLVVADRVQQHLFIHRDGMLRGEPSFAELKLANPQGLAIVNDTLYVADGNGRRVAVFRLKP
ncbi:MAG: hypothetical protein HYU78_08580 [Rhodocyclales bacterium]|nr:hypothetical protein [Rhodocyclales bacterium]